MILTYDWRVQFLKEPERIQTLTFNWRHRELFSRTKNSRLILLLLLPSCSQISLTPKTMAAWTAAARQASIMARLSSPKPASLVPRRRMSGGGGGDHTPRVNIWEDPMTPSKWKEEHFVIASLSGWGLLIYAGVKFSGKKEEKVGEIPNKA
ncbi:hypothetical protein RIF29_39196 [Crotalaria pallida]|uniref:Uncharacterized protein n=1 Tax=Crotalaria pallida TaxID=3830 RepID=A0AAN9E646_CROPI